MFCPSCGFQIPDGATFCPSCGNAVATANNAAQPANDAVIPAAYPTQQYQQPQNQQPYGQGPGEGIPFTGAVNLIAEDVMKVLKNTLRSEKKK